MTGTTIMPRRWDTFLQNIQNKSSLLQFISKCIKSKLFPGLKQNNMVTAYNEGTYSYDGTESATLSPCNHEQGTSGLFFTVKIYQNRELTSQ